MSVRRVLLLGRPGLLTQGVHAVLERESGVQVIGPHALDGSTATHVEAYEPDAVVIAAEDPSDLDLITQILRDFPSLPLVRVDLEENTVRSTQANS